MIGAETITLKRTTGPSTVGSDGRAQIPARTSTPIRAAVQPARGRDLQYLTEGLRQSVEVVVYTPAELRTADPLTRLDADHLQIDGETFEVVHIERHRSGIMHTKAFVRRVKEVA